MNDSTPTPAAAPADAVAVAAVTALDLVDILTLGELATAEELSGTSINALSNPSAPMVPLLIALACVVKRRTEPGYSLNQAEALTGSQLNEAFASLVDAVEEGEVPPAPVVTQNPAGGGDNPEG
jgi:hypothetical protein